MSGTVPEDPLLANFLNSLDQNNRSHIERILSNDSFSPTVRQQMIERICNSPNDRNAFLEWTGRSPVNSPVGSRPNSHVSRDSQNYERLVDSITQAIDKRFDDFRTSFDGSLAAIITRLDQVEKTLSGLKENSQNPSALIAEMLEESKEAIRSEFVTLKNEHKKKFSDISQKITDLQAKNSAVSQENNEVIYNEGLIGKWKATEIVSISEDQMCSYPPEEDHTLKIEKMDKPKSFRLIFYSGNAIEFDFSNNNSAENTHQKHSYYQFTSLAEGGVQFEHLCDKLVQKAGPITITYKKIK